MWTRDPVVGLCLVMLAAAALWACLVAGAVAAELWSARAHGRRAQVRRVVLACCGLALASPAAGATADDSGLAGLPLPDRAVGPAQHHTHQSADRDRTVVVRPGDCLWHLAQHDLPPGATDPQVAAHWRAIYRHNRTLIGADPDVIEPGQRLVLPRPTPR